MSRKNKNIIDVPKALDFLKKKNLEARELNYYQIRIVFGKYTYDWFHTTSSFTVNVDGQTRNTDVKCFSVTQVVKFIEKNHNIKKGIPKICFFRPGICHMCKKLNLTAENKCGCTFPKRPEEVKKELEANLLFKNK